MRYVGGKFKISKWVSEVIIKASSGWFSNYLEPFVGSCSVFDKIYGSFKNITIADYHKDLILLLQAVASGWEMPESVTKEEYMTLKNSPSSALRGFVGFGASFSGKWFGGYCGTVWDSYHGRYQVPHLLAAKKSLERLRKKLASVSIEYKNYIDHRPSAGTLIYCDPPYQGTLGYAGTPPFNHKEFWDTVRRWNSLGHLVIVSEAKAPNDFKILASRSRKALLEIVVDKSKTRQEYLFVHESIIDALPTIERKF